MCVHAHACVVVCAFRVRTSGMGVGGLSSEWVGADK